MDSRAHSMFASQTGKVHGFDDSVLARIWEGAFQMLCSAWQFNRCV